MMPIATVDDLLAEGIDRGPLERPGDRLDVTRRGRDEVERLGGG